MYQQVSEILCMAKQSNTAVISFICQDYTMARSVIYAAEKTNTPVLVMLYPEHVTIQKTTGIAGYAAMVKELAEEVKKLIDERNDVNRIPQDKEEEKEELKEEKKEEKKEEEKEEWNGRGAFL